MHVTKDSKQGEGGGGYNFQASLPLGALALGKGPRAETDLRAVFPLLERPTVPDHRPGSNFSLRQFHREALVPDSCVTEPKCLIPPTWTAKATFPAAAH